MSKDGTSQLLVLGQADAAGVYDASYSSPEDWFWDALSGGSRSESDIYVNADKALSYAPWFQGISIIAGDVARVPLDIFERDPNDNRIKHRDHDAYEVLNRQANRYQTAFTVRETLLAHALSWGNGYAAIERIGARVTALVPLPPETTQVHRTDDGSIVYSTRFEDGTEQYYGASSVLHVRGLGTGLLGYSVYRCARNSIGLGLAAERHGSRYFKNDARPGVVLKHPSKLSKPDADLLLDMWESRHGQNPSRPALAAGGLDVVPMPVSNDDAQYIESRKFQRDEIASWLALPPHKLGSDSRLSYNSVEAEERAYVSQTLMRWFKRFEAECDAKLLTERQKRAWWYFEHNTGALIQGDFETQASVAVQLKNAMIITKNEARKKFNLNSVDGGDKFENANTTSGGGQQPDTPNDATPNTQAYRYLIADRMAQLVRSECNSLKRIVRAHRPSESTDVIFDSLDKKILGMYERLESKIAYALRIYVDVYATVAQPCMSAEAVAKRYCNLSLDSLRDVVASVPAGQMAGAIEATMESWPQQRPQEVVEWIAGKP